jgi:hypothetical protein
MQILVKNTVAVLCETRSTSVNSHSIDPSAHIARLYSFNWVALFNSLHRTSMHSGTGGQDLKTVAGNREKGLPEIRYTYSIHTTERYE